MVSDQDAQLLRDTGQATHLLSLQKGCHLDSRVRQGFFNLQFYIDNHLVGGFANSRPRRADCNAEFKLYDHPGYQMTKHGDYLTRICYLQTTRAARRGEELFVWYCRHFPYTLQ